MWLYYNITISLYILQYTLLLFIIYPFHVVVLQYAWKEAQKRLLLLKNSTSLAEGLVARTHTKLNMRNERQKREENVLR
jgi:hypothetical protein